MTDRVTFTVLGRVINVEMMSVVQSVVNCLLFLVIVMTNVVGCMTVIMMLFIARTSACKK